MFSPSVLANVGFASHLEEYASAGDRLSDMMAASVEELRAQRVCLLKPKLVSLTATTQLAGARVKVKCCGSAATLMKSEVFAVPEGGGQLDLIEPIGHLVYEGDETLHFKLCRVHSCWGSSTVIASGSLSMAEVFGTVGLGGDTGSWTVPLMSEDGRQRLASLEVSIRCRLGTLGQGGGREALKKFALQQRPDVRSPTIRGLLGHTALEKALDYCAGCRRSRLGLQEATALAEKLASPKVETKRPPANFND